MEGEIVTGEEKFYCVECDRDFTSTVRLLGHHAFEIHKQLHVTAKLREAVAPFLKPQFVEILGGNVQGDDSPLYARNGATLTIGDFRRLQEAFRV